MKRFTSPLRNVKVASPCPADWDRMIGGDRARFCGQCELNVYNLSAMSTPEAESLIARTEGRLCVRYYRRKDGSIITQDCPVGLRALKQRALRIKRPLRLWSWVFSPGLAFTWPPTGSEVSFSIRPAAGERMARRQALWLRQQTDNPTSNSVSWRHQ